MTPSYYDKLTVTPRFLPNMPPDGYTTVTISTETAAKLSIIMINHDVDSMALAIDYGADLAIGEEKLTNAELARLLHHRLVDQTSE